jgi:hypothetical protein
MKIIREFDKFEPESSEVKNYYSFLVYNPNE